LKEEGTEMGDQEAVGNDVLVYAKIRDPEARYLLNSQLVNLLGERVSSTVYELATADWNDGLWDQARVAIRSRQS
jgi:hypothetical protein